ILSRPAAPQVGFENMTIKYPVKEEEQSLLLSASLPTYQDGQMRVVDRIQLPPALMMQGGGGVHMNLPVAPVDKEAPVKGVQEFMDQLGEAGREYPLNFTSKKSPEAISETWNNVIELAIVIDKSVTTLEKNPTFNLGSKSAKPSETEAAFHA